MPVEGRILAGYLKKKKEPARGLFILPIWYGTVPEYFRTQIMSISDLPGRLPITIRLIRSVGRDVQ